MYHCNLHLQACLKAGFLLGTALQAGRRTEMQSRLNTSNVGHHKVLVSTKYLYNRKDHSYSMYMENFELVPWYVDFQVNR